MIRRPLWIAAALSAALASCGGDDPPRVVELALAAGYDVTGVARLLPDGQTPAALKPVRFRYEALAVGSGALVGTLATADREVEIAGDIDTVTGEFTIAPFAFALTGTITEQVVELGGVGFDGLPEDGRIDEMSGFLRTELRTEGGRGAVQAYTVAASRGAARPAKPDVSKITTAPAGLGRTQVTGSAGAMAPSTGVELFVHGLAQAAPDFVVIQGRADGSFVVDVPGSPGDLVVVRGRTVGIAGEGDVFAIGP